MRSLTLAALSVAMFGPVLAPPAGAVAFNDLFVFGDSYSDTGSFVQYSNGPTAVAYLARDLGITLTTSQNADPGTDGVNFAQTAARITVGPTPPNTHPLSVNQQVGQFQNYVNNGSVTFAPVLDPILLGGRPERRPDPVVDSHGSHNGASRPTLHAGRA